jgi:phosphonate degradation associated HDIG domain protein
MQSIEQILDLYARTGQSEYFGEAVTQLEHALQCAFEAQQAGADEELVAASLLHDIGHLLADDPRAEREGEVGVINHDDLGGEFLRELGFSERLAALVSGHVDAKRYLTATNPAYYDRLSEASKETLRLQGGPMTADEAAEYGSSEYMKDRLRLRTWDELAKVPNREVPGLESYVPLLEKLLAGR